MLHAFILVGQEGFMENVRIQLGLEKWVDFDGIYFDTILNFQKSYKQNMPNLLVLYPDPPMFTSCPNCPCSLSHTHMLTQVLPSVPPRVSLAPFLLFSDCFVDTFNMALSTLPANCFFVDQWSSNLSVHQNQLAELVNLTSRVPNAVDVGSGLRVYILTSFKVILMVNF